jgi:FAD/FMN-containing dehydrogenase
VGIREVEVSEDRGTTRVGTGLRWGEVYEALEPQGLTVVGGRDSGVGVGGFLLGGEFISLRGHAGKRG